MMSSTEKSEPSLILIEMIIQLFFTLFPCYVEVYFGHFSEKWIFLPTHQ